MTVLTVVTEVTEVTKKEREEEKKKETRSSWFNCALRDDEAVCWVSIGHYEALAVGNW